MYEYTPCIYFRIYSSSPHAAYHYYRCAERNWIYSSEVYLFLACRSRAHQFREFDSAKQKKPSVTCSMFVHLFCLYELVPASRNNRVKILPPPAPCIPLTTCLRQKRDLHASQRQDSPTTSLRLPPLSNHPFRKRKGGREIRMDAHPPSSLRCYLPLQYSICCWPSLSLSSPLSAVVLIEALYP